MARLIATWWGLVGMLCVLGGMEGQLANAGVPPAEEPPPMVSPPLDAGVQPPPGVSIEVGPTLSKNGTFFQGWTSFTVRIQNDTKSPLKGSVRLRASTPWDRDLGFSSSAPYAVGEGAAHTIEVPLRVLAHDVEATVYGDDGELIFRRTLNPRSGESLVLVDLTENSPLRAWLDGRSITPTFAPPSRYHAGAPTALVLGARINPKTADPMVPERLAGWASADVVVARSDVLARLGDAQLLALGRFVLGGGTLAVIIARPEDMRGEPLISLVGGDVTSTAPPEIATEPLKRPAAPGPFGGVQSGEPLGGDLAETLSGYAGGNLRESPFGAVATYGLGEVVLLSFDPTKPPAVDDAWARERLFEMLRRAYDRRPTVAFRPGTNAGSGYFGGPPPNLDQIRRALDPNEAARWAIGIAALLLCLYAVIAGPVSYSRAAKRGRPLRAHVHLLFWAAGTFLVIVALGVATKGISGRARHVSLVEAGAGMSEGIARRYRGIYASDASNLTSYELVRGSVVSSALVDREEDVSDELRVDGNGARLEGVRALPWQTVVLREDGAASVGQGVSIVPEGKGDARIVNRTGRDLIAVVVRLPDEPTGFYLDRIPDGADALASDGRKLDKTSQERSWNTEVQRGRLAGTYEVHPLAAYQLVDTFDKERSGLGDVWKALESASTDVDWFPTGVPVLLAAQEGGPEFGSDSGLPVEREFALLRIVGWGGKP